RNTPLEPPPILGVHARFSGVNPCSKEKPQKTRQKHEWRAKRNPRFSGKILNKKRPRKSGKIDHTAPQS
ncbi:hypothetical protein, partial [Acetobacter tropicalis]|uniref:hypothetical protein n=1 Tax=Acetobacter tropicalis TaxID=104102 RepID=UPI001C3E71D2